MPSTYSGDPRTSANDAVRFALGDTDPAAFLLQDGEIAYLLEQNGDNVQRASIAGCLSLIAKLSALVDESVGSVSVSWSQRRAGYTALLATLQNQYARTGVRYRAYAGGTSQTDKAAVASNTDRVPAYFRRKPSRLSLNRDCDYPQAPHLPLENGEWDAVP